MSPETWLKYRTGTQYISILESVCRGEAPVGVLTDFLEQTGDPRIRDVLLKRSLRTLRRKLQKKKKHRQYGRCPECAVDHIEQALTWQDKGRVHREVGHAFLLNPVGQREETPVIIEHCGSCGWQMIWGVAELADAYRLGVTGRKGYLAIGPLWRKG